MRRDTARTLGNLTALTAASALAGCAGFPFTKTTAQTDQVEPQPTSDFTPEPVAFEPPETSNNTLLDSILASAEANVANRQAGFSPSNTGQTIPAAGAPATSNVPVTRESVQPANTGVQITQTVALAERTTPTPPSQNNASVNGQPFGPNLASDLYGQLLDLEVPVEPGTGAIHTTNIRQVTYTDDGSVFDPTVSGDGKHLVFASTQHRPTADVYIQEVGSRVVTRLTSDPAQDVMPSISPDGTRIAYASNRSGNWDIWIMPSTGGKVVQITSDTSHDLHPSWSPDGQSLVFSRLGQQSGRWELWVVDVFNTAQAQFIGYGLFPEWSPVASTGLGGADRILFQRSRERGERTFAVWTLDFDRVALRAGNETQISSDPNTALINPTWSPDAQFISFTAVPNPDAWIGEGPGALPPSAAVWITSIDGRVEVPLTDSDSIDMMPAWGPGGQMFFVSNRNGTENLWSLDIAPALLAAQGGDPINGADQIRVSAPNNRRGLVRTQNANPAGDDNGFVVVPTDLPEQP